jgi:hypothetical protein
MTKRTISRILFAFASIAGLLTIGQVHVRAIPNPPTQRADRFGVYFWGVDYSAYPGSPDKLSWGSAAVANIGTRTIRVALGAADPYRVNPFQSNDADPNWLVNVASTSQYAALFGSGSFQTYLLTVYTPADQRGDWVSGFAPSPPPNPPGPYEFESNQIEQLALYLNQNYGSKTFILLNWEGDNAMSFVSDSTSNQSRWDYYVNWLQSRSDGVFAAKSMGVGNVFFGAEFNLVKKLSGMACGSTSSDPNHPYLNRCLIDYVLPKLSNVDYYSYSSWQSVNVKASNPGASLLQTLNNDLGTAKSTIESGLGSTLSPANFILGEYGFARTIYGECNAANYVQEFVNAVDGPGSFGVSYAIFWQITDNTWRTQDGGSDLITNTAAGTLDWFTFGLYRQDDNNAFALHPTLTGSMLSSLVTGAPPPFIPGDCPSINQGGIVNGNAGWVPDFNPSSVMSIFGNNLSGYGDSTVRFFQGDHGPSSCDPNINQIVIIGNGSQWWFQSVNQINASIPGSVTTSGPNCAPNLPPLTGGAIVWVRDARGIDSNGGVINVHP